MKLATLLLLILGVSSSAGPLDRPAYNQSGEAARKAATPGLVRDHQGNVARIVGVVSQNIPDGGLLLSVSKQTVAIKGLPEGYLIRDGARLSVNVKGAPTIYQYTTVLGALTTVDCYHAAGTPVVLK